MPHVSFTFSIEYDPDDYFDDPQEPWQSLSTESLEQYFAEKFAEEIYNDFKYGDLGENIIGNCDITFMPYELEAIQTYEAEEPIPPIVDEDIAWEDVA